MLVPQNLNRWKEKDEIGAWKFKHELPPEYPDLGSVGEQKTPLACSKTTSVESFIEKVR